MHPYLSLGMAGGLADLLWLGTCSVGAPDLVAWSSLGSLAAPPFIPFQADSVSRLVVSNISTSYINSKKWQYYINHLFSISSLISKMLVHWVWPAAAHILLGLLPWVLGQKLYHQLRLPTLGSITGALFSLSALPNGIFPHMSKNDFLLCKTLPK